MRRNLIDEGSAATLMGIERSTVYGWCKNQIINCQNAPAEYADKTKYLIDEDECNYISNLIKKYGVRMALLNYDKNWKGESKNTIMSVQCNESNSKEQFLNDEDNTNRNEYKTTNFEDDANKLLSSILYAHQLKNKIKEIKDSLVNLEKEYNEIKEVISSQI